MQLPDERNSKRQISDEKEQKKNGHKKYNLLGTSLFYKGPLLITRDTSTSRQSRRHRAKGRVALDWAAFFNIG